MLDKPDKTSSLSINDTDMTTFFIFSKQLQKSGPLYLNYGNKMDIRKYINIGFMQTSSHFTKKEFKFDWFPARQCDKEIDFGKSNETLSFYDNYSNDYSLICPPLRNESNLELFGFESSPY